jgi:hypothetical protein
MNNDDFRFYAGEPPPSEGIQVGPRAGVRQASPALRGGLLYRLFLAIMLRLVAAIPVSLFAFMQYKS